MPIKKLARDAFGAYGTTTTTQHGYNTGLEQKGEEGAGAFSLFLSQDNLTHKHTMEGVVGTQGGGRTEEHFSARPLLTEV
jgi:hypothetical protein